VGTVAGCEQCQIEHRAALDGQLGNKVSFDHLADRARLRFYQRSRSCHLYSVGYGANLKDHIDTSRLVHQELEFADHRSAEALVFSRQLVETGQEVGDRVVSSLATDYGPHLIGALVRE
jgi:hypothetical protein